MAIDYYEGKNYYEILAVPRTATMEEIRKHYRLLVLEWHPDRNPDRLEEATERLKSINEAWDTLGDEDRRKAYDEELFGSGAARDAEESGGRADGEDGESRAYGGDEEAWSSESRRQGGEWSYGFEGGDEGGGFEDGQEQAGGYYYQTDGERARYESAEFDFGRANEAQRDAVFATDGPVLVMAGPGTGKTFTLVLRTVYLIQVCGVPAESIFIATFTEKAARELVTRITNEIAARGINADPSEMYIGTFHSLCLRILEEHLDLTRLRKSYRLLDAFDQQYTVYRAIDRFMALPGAAKVLRSQSRWVNAGTVCEYVNSLSEELIVPVELAGDPDPDIRAMGCIMEEYNALLNEENLLDFSSIQVELYRLLMFHPEVLAGLRSKISHIMIDEYQDTNYIQEQLVFLLGGERQNICVVGDDDQALYRFRGATVRNILEFVGRFPDGACRIVPLVTNYRSNSDIVGFYNAWMTALDWEQYRLDKTIVSHAPPAIMSPAVVRLYGGNEGEWDEAVLDFIQALAGSGRLSDYNQIAFLFKSVKNEKVKNLSAFLEANGISVYSPRSNMFFERSEIVFALGCLMLLFPHYVESFERGEYATLGGKARDTYSAYLDMTRELLASPEGAELDAWVSRTAHRHLSLKEGDATDYGYTGLLYQMFGMEPFASILNIDVRGGAVDTRPVRNLAQLTKLITKFEDLYRVTVLSGARIDKITERLFNTYFRLLFREGLGEFEDDSEYAPSGCVSFLTIHQAKGMEFPIVFVDTLGSTPRADNDDLAQRIGERYFDRPPYEPYDRIKYFDFWRLYYTAFSRAQNLLILTYAEASRPRTPSWCFEGFCNQLLDAGDPRFNIGDFDFKSVKDVNIKRTYSFTSGIAVYETCPMQYKFFRELEFSPVRLGATLFGTLVHETLSDVNRAALRGDSSAITGANITEWFNANYDALTKTQNIYLAPSQKDAALGQVLRYAEEHDGMWGMIEDAEASVTLVRPDYILSGTADLVIRGDDGALEIVDFKTQEAPDRVRDAAVIERYRRQVLLYAYLFEQKTGRRVSRASVYYTGGKESAPPVSYEYTREEAEKMIGTFDDTVRRIQDKDFSRRAKQRSVCNACDFRFFCHRHR